jgi:hypothetical protein
VKPVNDWLSQEKRNIDTMITLIAFALTLISPAPAAAAPATTPTATASTNNCYCQTIPLKDWGK